MIDSFATPAPLRETHPAAYARPGLVALLYGYRLVASLLLAAPIVAVGSSVVAGQPRGDAVLWEPGSTMLLEALRIGGRAAPALGTPSVLLLLVIMIVGLVPFAALVAGLGRRGPLPPGYLAARASAKIGTLAMLWGVGQVVEIVLAGLVFLLGAKLIAAFHLDPRGEDLARLALAAVALVVAGAAGVIRDFAMVSAVNDDTRFYTSCERALDAASRAKLAVAVSYAARALPAAAAIVFAAWIVGRRSEAAGAGVVGPFLIHQIAIAFAVFLRASWLAAALRFLDRHAPRPAG